MSTWGPGLVAPLVSVSSQNAQVAVSIPQQGTYRNQQMNASVGGTKL